MNTTRGIFEDFSNRSATPNDAPSVIAQEAAVGNPFTAVGSPFTAVASQDSPFSATNEKTDEKPAQAAAGWETADSSFQVAEPSEGYGYEGPAKASSFEAVPASRTEVLSSSEAEIAPFSDWLEPVAAEPVAVPEAASTPAPAEAAPAAESFGDSSSDSYSIRQLELRAVFGVDREMTTEEILERSRALPGIRAIARVSPEDMKAIEGIKNLLPNLGFGSGALKLYIGSVPLEFIREGKELLAVQTDGDFAPGVRETLMLVAREFGRSA